MSRTRLSVAPFSPKPASSGRFSAVEAERSSLSLYREREGAGLSRLWRFRRGAVPSVYFEGCPGNPGNRLKSFRLFPPGSQKKPLLLFPPFRVEFLITVSFLIFFSFCSSFLRRRTDIESERPRCTVDHLARGSMKNAANCASECELQDT